MALPTLVKTWREASNQAVAAQGSNLATCRRVLRSIKNSLVGLTGSPIAVRYSCNGTTAGSVGDLVDRWTTDADLVSANAGVAHSWIVLRSVQGWELLISLEQNSATLATISMWISWTGAFTGGTTTARPTAPDQFQFLTNGNWGPSADVAYKYNVQMPSDGSAIWVGICTGGAMVGTWDIVAPQLPAGVTPGVTWTDPIVGRVALGSGNLYIDSVIYTASNYVSRHSGVTLALSNTTEGRGTAGHLASLYTAVDARIGSWPMLGMGFFCTTVGNVSRAHGVWPDVYASVDASLVPTGSHAPLTPSPTYNWVKLGGIWRPWLAGAPIQLS